MIHNFVILCVPGDSRQHGRHQRKGGGVRGDVPRVRRRPRHHLKTRLLVRLAARLRRDGRLQRQEPLSGGARAGGAGAFASHRVREPRLLVRRHQAGRHECRQVQRRQLHQGPRQQKQRRSGMQIIQLHLNIHSLN